MAAVIARPNQDDDDNRRLKAELQVLRRKGALRCEDYDGGSGAEGRSCARCRAELGRIINRGAYCRACRLRVCKACREYSLRTTDWVCSVCHKHMEIQAATGEWMNEYVRRPSRRRDNRVYVPPADVIKRSIRRSWTISNPSPRWSSLRGSAELRAYSSLPRHQDHPGPLHDRSGLDANRDTLFVASKRPTKLSPSLKRRDTSPPTRNGRVISVDSVDSGADFSPTLSDHPDSSFSPVRKVSPYREGKLTSPGRNELAGKENQQIVRLRSVFGESRRASHDSERASEVDGSFERRSMIPVALGSVERKSDPVSTVDGSFERRSLIPVALSSYERRSTVGYDSEKTTCLDSRTRTAENMTIQQRRSMFGTRDSEKSSGIGSEGSFQRKSVTSESVVSPDVEGNIRNKYISDASRSKLGSEPSSIQQQQHIISESVKKNSLDGGNFQRRFLTSDDINRDSEKLRPDTNNIRRQFLIGKEIKPDSEAPSFLRQPFFRDEINRDTFRNQPETCHFQRRSLINDGINRNSDQIRQENAGFSHRSSISDGIQESPNFPRRSLIADGISRNSDQLRQESPYFRRRSVFNQDYHVEYSGTSDSGGEPIGTPPATPNVRKREEGPGLTPGADVEALSGAVFRKVTVKRRRQDTRRLLDNGPRSRRTRLTESLRVTEVSRRVTPEDHLVPDYLLETEGDDYKLVFISSDSSSKEEEFSHSDDADADSSSTSSTSTPGFTLDDCDWDYFESSSMVRPVLRDWSWHNRRSGAESGQSTAEDSPLPPRRLIYTRKRDSELDSDTPQSPKSVKRGDTSSDSFIARRSLPSSKSSSEWSILDDQALGGSYIEAPHSPNAARQRARHCVVRPDLDSSRERSYEEITCTDQYYFGGAARGTEERPAESLDQTPPGGSGRALGPDHLSEQRVSQRGGSEVTNCETCGAVTSESGILPVPVPVPIPVPIPASLWPLPEDSTLADIVYSAERDSNGSIRIRIKSLRPSSAVGPWCLWQVGEATRGLTEPGGTGLESRSVQSPAERQIFYEIVTDEDKRVRDEVNAGGAAISLEMMLTKQSSEPKSDDGAKPDEAIEPHKSAETVGEVVLVSCAVNVGEVKGEKITKVANAGVQGSETQHATESVTTVGDNGETGCDNGEPVEETSTGGEKVDKIESSVCGNLLESENADFAENYLNLSMITQDKAENGDDSDVIEVDNSISAVSVSSDTGNPTPVDKKSLPLKHEASQVMPEQLRHSATDHDVMDVVSHPEGVVLVMRRPIPEVEGADDSLANVPELLTSVQALLPRERLSSGSSSDSESSTSSGEPVQKIYHFTVDDDDDDDDNDDVRSEETSSEESTDDEDNDGKRFSEVFVVNDLESDSSVSDEETPSDEGENEVVQMCKRTGGIVLKKIRELPEDVSDENSCKSSSSSSSDSEDERRLVASRHSGDVAETLGDVDDADAGGVVLLKHTQDVVEVEDDAEMCEVTDDAGYSSEASLERATPLIVTDNAKVKVPDNDSVQQVNKNYSIKSLRSMKKDKLGSLEEENYSSDSVMVLAATDVVIENLLLDKMGTVTSESVMNVINLVESDKVESVPKVSADILLEKEKSVIDERETTENPTAAKVVRVADTNRPENIDDDPDVSNNTNVISSETVPIDSALSIGSSDKSDSLISNDSVRTEGVSDLLDIPSDITEGNLSTNNDESVPEEACSVDMETSESLSTDLLGDRDFVESVVDATSSNSATAEVTADCAAEINTTTSVEEMEREVETNVDKLCEIVDVSEINGDEIISEAKDSSDNISEDIEIEMGKVENINNVLTEEDTDKIAEVQILLEDCKLVDIFSEIPTEISDSGVGSELNSTHGECTTNEKSVSKCSDAIVKESNVEDKCESQSSVAIVKESNIAEESKSKSSNEESNMPTEDECKSKSFEAIVQESPTKDESEPKSSEAIVKESNVEEESKSKSSETTVKESNSEDQSEPKISQMIVKESNTEDEFKSKSSEMIVKESNTEDEPVSKSSETVVKESHAEDESESKSSEALVKESNTEDESKSKSSETVVKDSYTEDESESKSSEAIIKESNTEDETEPKSSETIVKESNCENESESKTSETIVKEPNSSEAIVIESNTEYESESKSSETIVKESTTEDEYESRSLEAIVKESNCENESESKSSETIVKESTKGDEYESRSLEAILNADVEYGDSKMVADAETCADFLREETRFESTSARLIAESNEVAVPSAALQSASDREFGTVELPVDSKPDVNRSPAVAGAETKCDDLVISPIERASVDSTAAAAAGESEPPGVTEDRLTVGSNQPHAQVVAVVVEVTGGEGKRSRRKKNAGKSNSAHVVVEDNREDSVIASSVDESGVNATSSLEISGETCGDLVTEKKNKKGQKSVEEVTEGKKKKGNKGKVSVSLGDILGGGKKKSADKQNAKESDSNKNSKKQKSALSASVEDITVASQIGKVESELETSDNNRQGVVEVPGDVKSGDDSRTVGTVNASQPGESEQSADQKLGDARKQKKKKRFSKWGKKKGKSVEADDVPDAPVQSHAEPESVAKCKEVVSVEDTPPVVESTSLADVLECELHCASQESNAELFTVHEVSPVIDELETSEIFGEERDFSSDTSSDDAGDVFEYRRSVPGRSYSGKVKRGSRVERESNPAPERYTSLVMITQDAPSYPLKPGAVSVVTSETTTLVNGAADDVIVRHTNWEDEDIDKSMHGGLAGYFTLTLENSGRPTVIRRPLVTKNKVEEEDDVIVVTGGDTLSAVVCLEEGLADDDSWVEEIDEREEEFATTTPTEDSSSGDEATLTTPMTAYGDREEELRGYHRSAIDFTLHTIVEESCEESEAEPERRRKSRPTSASELEKYFFFGLGGGNSASGGREMDSYSECSSIYSEGMESLGAEDNMEDGGGGGGALAEELASSRLEKYFLTGFMGFAGGDPRDSDGSGSVGSDSEGRPSPEQRRKRLVRARGTGRQHSNSNSLDNLVAVTEAEMTSPTLQDQQPESSSTETDDPSSAAVTGFEKTDGSFDTVKRKKKKQRSGTSSTPEVPVESPEEVHGDDLLSVSDSEDRNKTPQPELPAELCSNRTKHQSRDSGFIGSCDDLLKEPSPTPGTEDADSPNQVEVRSQHQGPYPPAVSLTRKDSFNNWSSDEETNLMMSKMRAFFKTMVAAAGTVQNPSSPTSRPKTPAQKPPQLVYFENELTRLMKTVPGIRDEQVREIVEYLSSEDTWSDSYDSSDYTSSDLEGAAAYYHQTTAQRTELQEQISQSCQQIINKFDTSIEDDDVTPNKDTALVYQRLVASFSKMAVGNESSDATSSPHSSPPLLAKVMHHIGSRLVALMHEVSSPKTRPRRPSSASTTTTEEEEDDDLQLPRSQSHDLLLARPGLRSSSSGVSDQDERFSWRGSFESALLAADSRTKLSAAKRRSAGDLASSKSCSREQLDRVRSCGSIGVEEKIWGRRRLSVPDANNSGASNDGDDDDDDDDDDLRSVTLPRSLQTSCAAGTNSLPRLPTSTASAAMHKSHSTHHVKSARYRPPGFNTRPTAPKRAVSAPGLQPRRDPQRRRIQPTNPTSADEGSISEEMPVTPGGGGSIPGTPEWVAPEEDIDRLVAIHQHRTSLSSLGARSDSLASVYSGAGEGRYGTVTVRGEVEFSLTYNYKASALEITVKQCRDLAPVDVKRNRSDPYVKVYLLPDKSKSGKRKTKVKKHTLNPVFDETLKFAVSLDGLESRTLWLTVWHSDMFGRNDFLGEVMMSLENKVFDDPSPRFYPLNERTEPFDDLAIYKGDIIIGLKFVPPDVTIVKKGKRSRGSLHVLVKEAKNLTAVKASGLSDPFCKCYLLPDKGRSSKQKTPVVRRNCSPTWNYTFVYEDVSLQELSERCLELTVWDHDRLASNEFLGGLRFSLGTGKHFAKPVDWMDANGKELTLWQSMLERPNFWVEGSIALRPSLDHRNAPS